MKFKTSINRPIRGIKQSKMERFEDFLMEDKQYKVPVVSSITLTEEQPGEALLNRLTQKEVRNEKGIVVKRVFGVLCLIAAIIQFIGIIVSVFRGYYDGGIWDVRFIIHLIVFGVFMVVAAALFYRNKAVTPISAYMKYCGSYFNAPDGNFELNITPLSNIVGIFRPLANVVEKLKSLYPVSIEIDEKEIVQFVGNVAEVVEKHYAGLPQDKGNDGSKFVYGVTCRKKTECHVISKISETLLSIDGGINIFRFYTHGKTVTGNCIKLNMRIYCVQVGKYWIPVNPVPRFVQFSEQ